MTDEEDEDEVDDENTIFPLPLDKTWGRMMTEKMLKLGKWKEDDTTTTHEDIPASENLEKKSKNAKRKQKKKAKKAREKEQAKAKELKEDDVQQTNTDSDVEQVSGGIFES